MESHPSWAPYGNEAGNSPPASPVDLPIAASPSELVVVDEVDDDSSSDDKEEAAAGPADKQIHEHSAQKFSIPWTFVQKLNAPTICGAGKNKTHICL